MANNRSNLAQVKVPALHEMAIVELVHLVAVAGDQAKVVCDELFGRFRKNLMLLANPWCQESAAEFRKQTDQLEPLLSDNRNVAWVMVHPGLRKLISLGLMSSTLDIRELVRLEHACWITREHYLRRTTRTGMSEKDATRLTSEYADEVKRKEEAQTKRSSSSSKRKSRKRSA